MLLFSAVFINFSGFAYHSVEHVFLPQETMQLVKASTVVSCEMLWRAALT